MRYKLWLCGLPLLMLPGCTASFNWPASLPQHLKLTWTGVTVSWPVIVVVLLALIIVNKVKRMIKAAGDKPERNER